MYAESAMHSEMNRTAELKNIPWIRPRPHRDQRAAYTLVEVILVLLILSLSAMLILPAVASRLSHLDEQRRLVRLVSEVRQLRDQAFSLRVPARLAISGTDLILFLDGKEKRRFPMDSAAVPGGEIRLNRFGMTPGGRLYVMLKRKWILRMKPGFGRVSIEKTTR